MGMLALAAAGRIVWRLTRRWAGAVAAWTLFAIATPLLWAARDVRLYGPLLGFTLLAAMALLEVLYGHPERRRFWAWIWGAMMLASLYSLVLAGFWLIGQGVFVLWALFRDRCRPDRFQKPVRSLGLPTLLAGLLHVPWAWAAVRALGGLGSGSGNVGYWAGYLPPKAFWTTTVRGITVSQFLPMHLADGAGGLIIVMALMALLALMALAPTQWRSRAALYPLVYAWVPLGILVYLFRTIPKWGVRHTMIFAPAPFLALAMGWGMVGSLRPRGWRRVIGGLLGLGTALTVALLGWADFNLLANPAFAPDDWRSLVATVQAQRRPGDVVIIETGAMFPAWVYYGGWEGVLPLPQDELLDVTHVLHYGNTAPVLNAALQGVGQVWIAEWLAEVTDPTGIVPALLSRVGRELETPSFHGLGVRRFVLTESPDFPPHGPPVSVQPGVDLLPNLHLWGATLPQVPHPADQPLEIWTWWTTEDPAAHRARFYQASLRLADSAGVEWVREDAPPGGGDYRPEHWPVATPVLGRFQTALPPGLPPGPYTATLSLYTRDATSAPTVLGQVMITRPLEVPSLPAGLRPVTATGGIAPLALLGVGLDQPKLAPCETLGGVLFWEAVAKPKRPYRAEIALGDYQTVVPITPSFPPPCWRVGERFATRFRLPISCRAIDLKAPLQVRLLEAEEAPTGTRWQGPDVEIRTGRQFEAPADMRTFPEASFGFREGPQREVATLLGYRLTPVAPRAGEPFTLTLFWEAGAPTDIPYTVFVHLTPSDDPGLLITQHDGWPALGQKPLYTWVEGEVVTDPHPLAGVPAGVYTLRVGLYGPDGTRLAVYTAAGDRVGDAVTVAVTVDGRR
jgi:hypothetical protein